MNRQTEVKEGMIFSLGHPLLDIIADVDQDFLEKWKLPRNSAILADPIKHDGLYDEMVSKYSKGIKFIPGGAVQNSMRIAQWFLVKPNVCVFMGCIGDDSEGRMMEEKANEDGVKTIYEITKEAKTGTCAVAINGINR